MHFVLYLSLGDKPLGPTQRELSNEQHINLHCTVFNMNRYALAFYDIVTNILT